MINKQRAAFWVTTVLIAAAALGFVFAAVMLAQGEKSQTCWLPEGCVAQYTENPYTYKVGTVSAAGIPEDAVVLRIQPLATYSLFTEDILFCHRSAIAPMFEEKHNPLVLTYRTQATRIIDGVGCHTLVRVDEMTAR